MFYKLYNIFAGMSGYSNPLTCSYIVYHTLAYRLYYLFRQFVKYSYGEHSVKSKFNEFHETGVSLSI